MENGIADGLVIFLIVPYQGEVACIQLNLKIYIMNEYGGNT